MNVNPDGMDATQDASTQHETRDVRYGPIVAAGAGLVALVVIAVALMLPFLGLLASRESAKSAPVSPLAGAYGRNAPPQPRLQARPLDDLAALRAAEAATLAGYGWVDEEAGIVRIPIERAIDLLASRGLPARRLP